MARGWFGNDLGMVWEWLGDGLGMAWGWFGKGVDWFSAGLGSFSVNQGLNIKKKNIVSITLPVQFIKIKVNWMECDK